MIFAIDYDDTIAEDPLFWEAFITMCKASKHTVTIVTFRSARGDNLDIDGFAARNKIDVVYTEGKQKALFFNADVWIDDMPILIPTHSALIKMAESCERRGDV